MGIAAASEAVSGQFSSHERLHKNDIGDDESAATANGRPPSAVGVAPRQGSCSDHFSVIF